MPADAVDSIMLLEVDISQPLPYVAFARSEKVQPYKRARCLIRANTLPLGVIELTLQTGNIDPDHLAKAIWQAIQSEILTYLQDNGLPPISCLDSNGLPAGSKPRHLEEREKLLRSAPPVSVVIATRDRPDMLARCLAAFQTVEYPSYELIVVDNAPQTNASREVVASLTGKLAGLRYVREDLPGLSRARNAGLSVACSEIIAITDDDVQPDPHWITELVSGFNYGSNVACVTGPIIPLELETPAQVWIEQFGGFNKGFSRRVFDMGENRPSHHLYPYAAGIFGSGANLAFKTSILRDLGGFDPALGAGSLAMSGEEFKVFVQILSAGYQIAYSPAAVIYHGHHPGYPQLERQIYGYAVGLTAFLTSLCWQPRHVWSLAGKIFPGIRFAFDPRSQKNAKRQNNYPEALKHAELRGMLYGPVAYLMSCYRVFRENRSPGRKVHPDLHARAKFAGWVRHVPRNQDPVKTGK